MGIEINEKWFKDRLNDRRVDTTSYRAPVRVRVTHLVSGFPLMLTMKTLSSTAPSVGTQTQAIPVTGLQLEAPLGTELLWPVSLLRRISPHWA